MAMPQARSQKDCLLHLLFLRLPEHPGKGQSSQQTIRHEAITHKLKILKFFAALIVGPVPIAHFRPFGN
jgi:hypothetical protein